MVVVVVGGVNPVSVWLGEGGKYPSPLNEALAVLVVIGGSLTYMWQSQVENDCKWANSISHISRMLY